MWCPMTDRHTVWALFFPGYASMGNLSTARKGNWAKNKSVYERVLVSKAQAQGQGLLVR